MKAISPELALRNKAALRHIRMFPGCTVVEISLAVGPFDAHRLRSMGLIVSRRKSKTSPEQWYPAEPTP